MRRCAARAVALPPSRCRQSARRRPARAAAAPPRVPPTPFLRRPPPGGCHVLVATHARLAQSMPRCGAPQLFIEMVDIACAKLPKDQLRKIFRHQANGFFFNDLPMRHYGASRRPYIFRPPWAVAPCRAAMLSPSRPPPRPPVASSTRAVISDRCPAPSHRWYDCWLRRLFRLAGRALAHAQQAGARRHHRPERLVERLHHHRFPPRPRRRGQRLAQNGRFPLRSPRPAASRAQAGQDGVDAAWQASRLDGSLLSPTGGQAGRQAHVHARAAATDQHVRAPPHAVQPAPLQPAPLPPCAIRPTCAHAFPPPRPCAASGSGDPRRST